MKQEQPDEALLSQVAQTSDQCHLSLIGMGQGFSYHPCAYLIMLPLCYAQCSQGLRLCSIKFLHGWQKWRSGDPAKLNEFATTAT